MSRLWFAKGDFPEGAEYLGVVSNIFYKDIRDDRFQWYSDSYAAWLTHFSRLAQGTFWDRHGNKCSYEEVIRPTARPVQAELKPENVSTRSNKYHVELPCKGVYVDVYDVLVAYNVTNPAVQHAIKKLLMPGQRGVKTLIQDLEEAYTSLKRALEIETQRSK